uniref:Neurturin n=1 Tax=Erpetoichthys calabaricus TaxID=27687 RepID=A0A8C4SVK1_ERPCA
MGELIRVCIYGNIILVLDKKLIGLWLSHFTDHLFVLPFLPVTALLQSYTEGDVQQLISSLIDRHRPDSKDLMASTAKRTKRAKKGLKPCSLKELEVSVSELGLGYEGEEILLFRYCSGKCHSSRRNYDLTLEHMKKRGRVKKGKARHKPCCRPTAYDDDISFLDTNNQYHTIKDVSAKECGCV